MSELQRTQANKLAQLKDALRKNQDKESFWGASAVAFLFLGTYNALGKFGAEAQTSLALFIIVWLLTRCSRELIAIRNRLG